MEKQISIFYKITALWVICEAFAGGIMHTVKIPFTGMFISSLSVICITLIAWYTSARYILKATLLVIIFKFSLSPHSPPTAYLAVLFQGLMGYFLFLNKRFFTAAAILLGALALVESALQRILVLIFLYGKDFWQAIDAYVYKLTGSEQLNQISYWIAFVYISIHFIFGVFVGSFAANLARNTRQWAAENPQFIFDSSILKEVEINPVRKKRKTKYFFYFLFLLMILFYIHAWVYPASSILSQSKVASLLLRTALILLGWFLILNPLFTYFLKKYATKKKTEQKAEFSIIMGMIPEFKKVFIKSWQLSAQQKYTNRLQLFLKILLLNTLYANQEENIS